MRSFSSSVIHQTNAQHVAAINTQVIQKYMKESLSLAEHAAYLLQQYYIYRAFEEELPFHKESKIFKESGLYDLLVSLKRSEALLKDYAFVRRSLKKGETPAETELWPETKKIISAIKLSREQPEKFLAHAFVNYLALLNGGMILKPKTRSVLSSALAGEEDSSAGVAFYSFSKAAHVLNEELQTKVDAIAGYLNPKTFLEEVELSYKLTIEQLNDRESSCQRFSANLNQFWERNKAVIIPVAAVAAVSLIAALR